MSDSDGNETTSQDVPIEGSVPVEGGEAVPQDVIPQESAPQEVSIPQEPVAQEQVSEAPTEAMPTPEMVAVPPPPPAAPQGPLKILMVDDDESFREIFSAKFTASGFVMKTLPSGKAAREFIAKGEFVPDLILMDINMPGESGTDVAFALKQDPKTENLRIAFLTNLKEPWPAISGSMDKVAKELGMEDFLEKTDDLDNLVKKVTAILSHP